MFNSETDCLAEPDGATSRFFTLNGSACLYVCVCVCVRERGREREKQRETDKKERVCIKRPCMCEL